MKILNAESNLPHHVQKDNSRIGIRKVIFEVHKPLEPSIIELVEKLSVIDGVKGLDVTLYETDRTTEMLKITVEGEKLDYDILIQAIEHLGGVVRSVERVIAGEIYEIEKRETNGG